MSPSGLESPFSGEIAGSRVEMHSIRDSLKHDIETNHLVLEHTLELLRSSLTIRLGTMMFAGMGLLFAALRAASNAFSGEFNSTASAALKLTSASANCAIASAYLPFASSASPQQHQSPHCMREGERGTQLGRFGKPLFSSRPVLIHCGRSRSSS
jgi:hypothetical protein